MRPAPPRRALAAGRDLFGHRRSVDDWRVGLDRAAAEVALDAQIACVRRELKLRHELYTERVRGGILRGEVARRELAAMTAVLRTLQRGRGP